MSVPAGYKEYTYIEVSGGQYINTGLIPDSNTRVVMDFELADTSANTAIFGSRTGTSSKTFSFFWLDADNGSQYRSDFSTKQLKISGIEGLGRHTVDKNKNKCTLDGTTVTHTSSTFTGEYYLYLASVNTAGTAYADGLSGKIYSCQIYSDGTLVRDFVPCMNPAGEAGLYDNAGGVFCGNAGSGEITLGERVPGPPDSPERFDVSGASGTVILEWNTDENALGYRIYRGGVLLADTADAYFEESELAPYSGHLYTVVPYNDLGEGYPASVEVAVRGSGDVFTDLVTDRTEADVTARNPKGSYNDVDLNRVSAAAARVSLVLDSLGYAVKQVSDRVWIRNEIPDSDEMAAHHESVVGLDVIGYSKNKVVLPESLSRLTYEGANNIEKFLRLCGEAAERIPEAYIYSDEIYGGEIN